MSADGDWAGKAASSRGATRTDRGARPACLAGFLRERLRSAARVLRRTQSRATTDPAAPIRTWDQSLIPADNLGMADRSGDDWLVWPGRFARNDELPGEPGMPRAGN